MTDSVYIRPLVLQDALVSWRWRNNPRLWKLTGSRPDRVITPEIETEWLAGVLTREDEKRFAICLSFDHRYIGNIYLTAIRDRSAYVHIFIGEMEYWGKGRAHEAVCLACAYAFGPLGLHTLHAQINKNNAASLALAAISGFRTTGEDDDYVRLIFTQQMYNNEGHLAKNTTAPHQPE
jgi:RimJ/RimL family protein N-acetyltransferase